MTLPVLSGLKAQYSELPMIDSERYNDPSRVERVERFNRNPEDLPQHWLQ